MAALVEAGAKAMKLLKIRIWRRVDVEDVLIVFACVVVIAWDKLF